MKCPYCYAPDKNYVIEHSRKKIKSNRGDVVRRKRRCNVCGNSFITIEYVKNWETIGKERKELRNESNS